MFRSLTDPNTNQTKWAAETAVPDSGACVEQTTTATAAICLKNKKHAKTTGGGILPPSWTNKAKTKQKAMKHFVQGLSRPENSIEGTLVKKWKLRNPGFHFSRPERNPRYSGSSFQRRFITRKFRWSLRGHCAPRYDDKLTIFSTLDKSRWFRTEE